MPPKVGCICCQNLAVALSLFDMLWAYIKGEFSQNISFLGGHLLSLFFCSKVWATLVKWKIKVDWKYLIWPIQRNVFIYRVQNQRCFSIIFITDINSQKTRKMTKPGTFGGKCAHGYPFAHINLQINNKWAPSSHFTFKKKQTGFISYSPYCPPLTSRI